MHMCPWPLTETCLDLFTLLADFKQVLGQRGSKGPALPSKLTAHQTQIVKALIAAHADDIEVPVPAK